MCVDKIRRLPDIFSLGHFQASDSVPLTYSVFACCIPVHRSFTRLNIPPYPRLSLVPVSLRLGPQRQLDECRVHAAHLEAFSRLLQLELAGSDHLLAQLITAFREQHRVLGYMKFVTPELEAQYKVSRRRCDVMGSSMAATDVCKLGGGG